MSGKMGVITHKITIQSLSLDEIRFAIPVTNTSTIEQCFLVYLYDEQGVFVAKHPVAAENYVARADKVLPGQTEIMYIDSNWEDWNISHVAGETITFKLMADPTKLLGFCEAGFIGIGDYKVVDTKQYALAEHTGDKPATEVAQDLMKTLTILITVAAISYVIYKLS